MSLWPLKRCGPTSGRSVPRRSHGDRPRRWRSWLSARQKRLVGSPRRPCRRHNGLGLRVRSSARSACSGSPPADRRGSSCWPWRSSSDQPPPTARVHPCPGRPRRKASADEPQGRRPRAAASRARACRKAEAPELVRRARTELLATRSRRDVLTLTGAESVTASQRRVAELAATGLTTREIAETLFATPRRSSTTFARSTGSSTSPLATSSRVR